MILRLLPIALLAACAGPGQGGGSLSGSEWRFTEIDGAPPVAGEATLSFRGGDIGANVGCNGMGGPWRIEGERLIAGPLVSTQMFCEGRMEQERAVSSLLSGGPILTVEGDRMSVKSSAHSAELVRRR